MGRSLNKRAQDLCGLSVADWLDQKAITIYFDLKKKRRLVWPFKVDIIIEFVENPLNL